MKKATAILLQNMLARIKNLENQVENVIVNSTMEFRQLNNAIKSLNKTISNLTRPAGNYKKQFMCQLVNITAVHSSF